MEDRIHRYYRPLFGICMATIVILSFYVGMLEGERGSRNTPVVLSCSDEVLASLRIPRPAPAALMGRNSNEDFVPQEILVDEENSSTPKGMFAGSKNGTKYYSPDCSGLNRIKPENIIWFQNAEDATLQGYTPANC